MVWTAPMTAVANTIFTAAQFNQYVRDNLNETAPAKATTAGQYFVATGTNAIATRQSFNDIVSTSESTSTTTYTDLATVGPAVSVNCGPKAIVMVTARVSNNTVNSASYASYTISGATSRAATDAEGLEDDGRAASNTIRMTAASLATGLTTGVNIFTMKYRAGSNTSTFSDRQIIVIPF
jgi:hypothetical protein